MPKNIWAVAYEKGGAILYLKDKRGIPYLFSKEIAAKGLSVIRESELNKDHWPVKVRVRLERA